MRSGFGQFNVNGKVIVLLLHLRYQKVLDNSNSNRSPLRVHQVCSNALQAMLFFIVVLDRLLKLS
jgi:hypothetical protein